MSRFSGAACRAAACASHLPAFGVSAETIRARTWRTSSRRSLQAIADLIAAALLLLTAAMPATSWASTGCDAINNANNLNNVSTINNIFDTGSRSSGASALPNYTFSWDSPFAAGVLKFSAGDRLDYVYIAAAGSVPRVKVRTDSGPASDTFTPKLYTVKTTVTHSYTFVGNETNIGFFAAPDDSVNAATIGTSVQFLVARCTPSGGHFARLRLDQQGRNNSWIPISSSCLVRYVFDRH